MINRIKKILLVVSLIVLFSNRSVFALNYIKNDSFICDETEEYKRWSKLSDADKKLYLEPIRCKETISIGSVIKLVGASTDYTASSFDLRNVNGKNYVTPVRSQAMANGVDSNMCSFFATVNAIESDYLYQGGTNTVTFSPRHIDFSFNSLLDDGTTNLDGYYNWKTINGVSSGGNYFMTGPYLAARRGPILESKLPFSVTTSSKANVLNQKASYNVKNVIYYFNNSNNCGSSTIVTNIKKMVATYGAVAITLHSKVAYMGSDNVSYYYNGNDEVTHANVIVGWDDNYPKENFAGSAAGTPTSNGAWIVKDNYNEIGNAGYYYISYETKDICTTVMALNDISNTTVDNTYYYNTLGFANGLYQSDVDTVYYKQVYNRKSNYAEVLKEVNIFVDPNDKYELYYSDTDDFSKATKIGSGTAANYGYITVPVTSNIKITGDKYYIYLKYTTDYELSNRYVFPVYSNYSADDPDYSRWHTDNITAGVSYYSLNGDMTNEQWIDTTTNNGGAFYPLIYTFTNNERYNLSSNTPVASSNEITPKKGGYYEIKLDLTNISLSSVNVKVLDSNNNDVTSAFTVSTISNGYKIAVKKNVTEPGTYTVKFSYDNLEATEQIIVFADTDDDTSTNTKVTAITISGLDEVSVNGTLKLTANVFPEDAINKEVYWASADTNIARVDSQGNVMGRKAGTVKIYAISVDNPSVRVDKTIKVIDINKEEGNGETIPINNEVTPKPNNTNNDISNNPDTGGKMGMVLVILVLSVTSIVYVVKKGNVI